MHSSTFQLIVTGICIALLIVGIGVFAAYGGLGGNSGVGTVTIWGTVDQNTFDAALQTLRQQDKSFADVHYVQQDATTYDTDVVNAMASGQAPDLFLVSQEDMGTFSDKITPIPYSAVSQATLADSFIQEGQLFLTSQGSLALPLLVDPLVMYYNRDMLTTAGIAQPPQYWSDLLNIAPKITALDSSQNIQQSAATLGEWSNIPNAKAILSALIMQAGDPIIGQDSSGAPTSVFGSTPQGAPENPASSALQFYTEFANPSKTTYSWNRSLPSAPDAFVAGDVALYFGFASEDAGLTSRNPNLHFGVALLPQIQGNSTHMTYGLLTGVAIPRGAANPQGALTIAEKLTSQAGIEAFAQAMPLPPVRTDVTEDTSNNAAASIFVQSALIARGWLDPDSAATDSIFQSMIDSVVSGGSTPDQAVQDAASSLQTLVRGTTTNQ